jgi:hypothetical protein
MYLRFEVNPNFGFSDDRLFQERSEPKEVTHILRKRQGKEVWCPITGLNNVGQPQSALACKVEDSGEGLCTLVYGGLWGLRLKDPSCNDEWALDDPHQWGEAFLLLPAGGSDIRLA